MKKRLIASVTCVCLLLIMLLSSTLAWFTDQTEATKSTMTVGNVAIAQLEQYRDYQDDGSFILSHWHTAAGSYQPVLYPAVPDAVTNKLETEPVDIYGQQYDLYYQQQSVYDKIVSVINTGSDPAFARTIFAFEMMKTADGWVNPVDQEVILHSNVAIEFPLVDGENVIIYRKGDQTTGTEDVAFVVGVAIYNEALGGGVISVASLLQFYLNCGNEFITAVGPEYEILALSQAVQLAGFENHGAARALNMALGEVNAPNAAEWFGEGYEPYVKPADERTVIVVNSAEEAQAALDTLESGATIQLAPGVNYGVLEIGAQVGFGENKKPAAANGNTVSVDYFTTKYPTGEFTRTLENITILGAPGAKVDAIKFVTGAFKLTNPDTGKETGSMFQFVEIKNLVIDGLEFTDKSEFVTEAGRVSPIFIDLQRVSVDGLTVKNCKLEGNKDNMNFVYAYGGAAKDCTFGVTLKNVSIIGNTVSGIARLCELREAENVTILNNIVSNLTREMAQLGNNKDANNVAIPYSGNIICSGNIVNNIATDYAAEGMEGLFFRVGAGGEATVIVTNNVITNSGCVAESFVGVTNHTGTLIVENNSLKK